MSDTPIPASPKKRPWTILGRLSKAVREQNWFAVVLELAIVVLGVVIGFQVTSWGQERADRVQEQVYLRQLVDDLAETERRINAVDSLLVDHETASGSLMRSFYAIERPNRDTLRERIHASGRFQTVYPVTGTAEALIATGDLALIQNDSLRSAITTYLGETEWSVQTEAVFLELFQESFKILRRGWDNDGHWTANRSQAEIDSMARADPSFPFPPGTRRAPFPLDVEAFLSDPLMLDAATDNHRARDNIRWTRSELRKYTTVLRHLVEDEIQSR